MADVVLLKKERKILKQTMTRILKFCQSEQVQLEQLRVRAEKAEELIKKFEQIQCQIDSVTDNEQQLATEEEYRSEFEATFFEIKAIYYKCTDQAEVTAATTANQSNSDLNTALQALIEHQASMSALVERVANNVHINNTSTPNSMTLQQGEFRLPTIKIPEFDGNLLEWVRFKDLFEALVHNKTNVSDVEKLEYLHTKLTGDALLVIKHLKPTNSNYAVAWEVLNKKYNNTEKIKNTYMELVFEQPPMKSSSLSEAKRIYDSVNEGFNALKALDPKVEEWSLVLLYSVEKKLDNGTALLWHRDKQQNQPATFAKFLSFMEKRVSELECIQGSQQRTVDSKQQQPKQKFSRTYSTNIQSCPLCAQQHFLFQCERFKEMKIEERRQFVQKNSICYNCLRTNHTYKDCKSSTCRKCNKRHNTMLHIANHNESNNNAHDTQATSAQTSNHQWHQTYSIPIENNRMTDQTPVISSAVQRENNTCVLLPTAVIQMLDRNGFKLKLRALLDTGSQGTLIAESCVQQLGLKRDHDKTMIFGVGNNNGNYSCGIVHLQININNSNDIITTQAYCLKNLTKKLPSHQIEIEKINYFNELQMADPYFYKPANIDIILGADIVVHCMLPQKLIHPSGSPMAVNTLFGWVLMGQMQSIISNAIYTHYNNTDCDELLKQFWEVEDVQVKFNSLTLEEEACEKLFAETTKRDQNGHFIVRLPKKNNIIDIGESKTIATKRLQSMERKFKQYPQVHADYSKFMQEYIDLGHMTVIEPTDNQPIYYLPHHAVLKPSSTTTKLRVVFDGSCKSSNGKSLNDNLLTGFKVQRDLFDIIISFRLYAVAFTGDLEKMYRQVMVHESDRPLQCILWRESEEAEIKTYKLNTITYGTAPAAFLATRSLKQIANEHLASQPAVAESIDQHFYVDDCICSVNHLQEAIKLRADLSSLLAEYGFNIRKWSSNSSEFIDSVPNNERATAHIELNNKSTVSTLGLLWNTEQDTLKYSVESFRKQADITKRAALSSIARIYDPMDWISPVVIRYKIFLQKLWLLKLNWDDPLPYKVAAEWVQLFNSISEIANINIERCLNYADKFDVELHGFSDASEEAYAAVVFIKVNLGNNNFNSNIIAAKTRVAPIKQLSLARLELCAAHLLTKLVSKILKALKRNNITVHAWTDSTIVLAWLSDHPRRWLSFVGNRTAEILSIVSRNNWHYIKSQNNPADMASRGVSPSQLVNDNLWWHGPDELKHVYPEAEIDEARLVNVNKEERKSFVVNSGAIENFDLISRYSSLSKLTRITALLLRFKYNCSNRENKRSGFLSVSELRIALFSIVKTSQKTSFKEAINILALGHQLPSKHKVSSLNPFLDKDGVMRVGGRITNANITYEQMHPMILSGKNELSKLIIRQYHIQNCHAGKRLLYYLIRLKFWITSTNQAIKEIIYKCPTCMRMRARPYQQQMGNLPTHRVTPTPVFTNVGIDYAGPVQVLSWKGRGNKLHKSWISIFVCMVTKAVHIELVSELSTSAFIAALHRFIARRGKPANIYSDNGTNFVGANRYLAELYAFLKDDKNQQKINSFLTQEEVKWHFSPPSAPHFGGIWEAGVKSIKHHLNRVLKTSRPTFEELTTILCQIEMCLNSRPLCIKFDDDVDPLTPAHFILLRAMHTIPDENNDNKKENCLTRWQYAQRIVQQFWRKWSNEYLHQMQQRPKWKKRLENIAENDVVVIKDQNLSPTNWLLGKVIKLHCGGDGLARVAVVKTAAGELKRPVSKLCPILVNY